AHIRGPFRFANQNACYLAFLQSKMLASDILYPLQDECTTSLYSALTVLPRRTFQSVEKVFDTLRMKGRRTVLSFDPSIS
ncbi:MAG: hypothetical protein K5919_02300, partial [Clostridiales bacterium]|nr:hypothetical protein [Clostridiales bacterium]